MVPQIWLLQSITYNFFAKQLYKADVEVGPVATSGAEVHRLVDDFEIVDVVEGEIDVAASKVHARPEAEKISPRNHVRRM